MSVDATLGGSSSDSYVSNAAVDAYWVNRNDSVWDAATSAEADAALREATQYLDGKYDWVGSIATTTQSLGWPRLGAADKENRDLTGIVPVGIVSSCCELALQALSGPLVTPGADRGGDTKREKVGDIEVEYFASAPSGKTFDYVKLLLKGLTTNGNGYVEIIRG